MDKPVPTPEQVQEKKAKDLFFKALQINVEDEPEVVEQPVVEDKVESEEFVGDSLSSMVSRGSLKEKSVETPVVETPEKPEEKPESKEKPLGEVPPPTEKKVSVKPIPVAEVEHTSLRETPVALPEEVDVGDISDLSEDEQYEVELAKYAERANPSKYSGRAKAVVKYVRDHRKLAAELSTEDPEGDVTSNPKYQRFVKTSRPEFSTAERNKLLTGKIKEEAKREVTQEFEEKYLSKIEKDLRTQKVKPGIDKTVAEFVSQVATQLPDEDDPIVKEVSSHIKGEAKLAAEEFLAVSSNLKPFDPKNPHHDFLARFIEEQGQQLVTSKSPHLKRGTQTFLPRAQFNALPAADRAKHFTFTDEDVLQMLVVNAKHITENAIKDRRAYFEKLGYAPVKKAAAATPPPKVDEEAAAPKASLSASSGHTPVPAGIKKSPWLSFIENSTK